MLILFYTPTTSIDLFRQIALPIKDFHTKEDWLFFCKNCDWIFYLKFSNLNFKVNKSN